MSTKYYRWFKITYLTLSIYFVWMIILDKIRDDGVNLLLSIPFTILTLYLWNYFFYLENQNGYWNATDREDDEVYQKAKQIVLESGHTSISLLQRKLRLGYARAARLLDEMEEDGIVGPADGGKPREIIYNKEK